MKTIIPVILLFFVFKAIIPPLSAQTTLSSFEASGTGVSTTMANDYQSLGINPANLGFQGDERSLHFSFLESSISLSSDALSRSDIWETFVKGGMDGFSNEDKINAAKTFAKSGFMLNADFNIAAFSFQNDALGGIALMIRERFNNQFRMNDNLAELLFLGNRAEYLQNNRGTSLGTIFDGSKLSGSWYREIILGYGRKFMDIAGIELFAGADVKYILGYGNLNIYGEGDEFYARSAITPGMEIDYDISSPTTIAKSGFEPVGKGFGLDFGATARFLEIFKVGVSFNDLGSITWDGNTYEAPNINVDSISSDGFDSYNFVQEFKEMFGNDHLIQWKGREEYKTGLPAHVKFGGSIKPIKWFEAGFDIYAPLNNHAANMDKAIYSFGTYLRIANAAKLSLGYVNGDVYNENIPLGMVFIIRNWEWGIATGDIMTFFRQENPNISIASGFLRFKFGKTGS